MAFHYKLLAARNPRRAHRLACGSARKHPDHRSHPTSNMNCDIPDERCWRTYLWRFVVSVNILKVRHLEFFEYGDCGWMMLIRCRRKMMLKYCRGKMLLICYRITGEILRASDVIGITGVAAIDCNI